MTRFNIAQQYRSKRIAKKDEPTKNATPRETENDRLAIPSQVDLQVLSPSTLLHLQRIIGNHALQRELGDDQTETIPTRPRSGPRLSPKTPTRTSPGAIPLWAQFRRSILDAASKPLQIRSNANQADLNADTLDQRRDAVLDHIRPVYVDYDADNSLSNLVKLYHKLDQWHVMYWDHSDLRKAGLRTAGIQALFNTTRTSIERKIRNHVARNGADPADVSTALNNATDKQGKAPKTIKFFEDVGVPIEFYGNLSKQQVVLFKNLYNALAKNKAQKIPIIIAQLNAEQIVGFPIIKGLFLTRFPAAAGIENLQNSNYVSSSQTKELAFAAKIKNQGVFGASYTSEELKAEAYGGDNSQMREQFENNLGGKTVSKNLTNAELSALLQYTGGDYTRANKNLRGNNASTPDDPEKKKQVEQSRARNEVIVSALNKLPAYNGIAYRMQNGWEHFDAAVKPGGMFSDLAFMSASMTAEGAELGGLSGGGGIDGALEVFEIIHTKSARKVTLLSYMSHETEVLFTPGARFQVKAIWGYVNGRIPKDAPLEAQMILLRNGPTKTRSNGVADFTGNVRVVELVEV